MMPQAGSTPVGLTLNTARHSRTPDTNVPQITTSQATSNVVGASVPERRFIRYSYGVLIVSMLVAIAVSLAMPPISTASTHNSVWWVAPLLFCGFMLVEQLGFSVDVRSGVSWTVSFSEIPLVIGFFVAPFEIVLVTHVLAASAILLLHNVRGRMVYNLGTCALEISGAFVIASVIQRVLEQPMSPSSMTWAAVWGGAIAAPVISTSLALIAVHTLGQRMQPATALRLTGRVLIVGLVNASVGLGGYLVIVHIPEAWPVVLAFLAGLFALYWAYSSLLREQRDMEALSDVSLMVARSGRTSHFRTGNREDPRAINQDWTIIAARIQDQLAATRTVLRVRSDSDETLHTVVSGKSLATALPETLAHDPLLARIGPYVRHIRLTGNSELARDALALRDAREALVVPLRSGDQWLGVIEAHDRRSRWRGFGKSDVQLLELMASHVATSLENRRLVATLRHDAYHDPLTGLLNRLGFRHTAYELLRENQHRVVLRVDLEIFASVSEALGHEWSDQLAVVAGKRIRDALGPTVSIARLEGTSFAVVMDAIDSQHGSSRHSQVSAELLRTELSAPYVIDRLSVEADAVIGYSQLDSKTFANKAELALSDVDVLLRQADMALGVARDSQQTLAYTSSMDQVFLRRFQLVTQFRQALEADQLVVHYQPKVSLANKRVLGVEALIRWQHPEFGWLAPDEFVPAVEAAGLVGLLTNFVLEQSLGKVRHWLDAGMRIGAAVNLSVRNLSDGDFPRKVAAALRRFEVPARLLTFELTESCVMSEPEKALPVLRELRELGVTLAVDDFGTGYSSLAYLKHLPIDQVKIDKSFVFGLGTDLGDVAVVRSIVELSHSLGLTVVAEGVEDELARRQLELMGCDVAQGYLLSRPLPADSLNEWLHTHAGDDRNESLEKKSLPCSG